MRDPHETTETTPAVVLVLDPDQPLRQAAMTRWLLDTLRHQRGQETPAHGWWCACVRLN